MGRQSPGVCPTARTGKLSGGSDARDLLAERLPVAKHLIKQMMGWPSAWSEVEGLELIGRHVALDRVAEIAAWYRDSPMVEWDDAERDGSGCPLKAGGNCHDVIVAVGSLAEHDRLHVFGPEPVVVNLDVFRPTDTPCR